MSEIIYPATETGDSDEMYGNFIRPENYRIPNFCPGCPLPCRAKQPQISIVSDPGSEFSPGFLLLSDASDKEFEPAYLGEVPFVFPLRIDAESGDSRALGAAQVAIAACKEPITKKRLIEADKILCGAGFKKVTDYKGYKQLALGLEPKELRDNSQVIVGPETPQKIERMLESAKAREAAGRPLISTWGTPESLGATAAAHEAVMRSLRIDRG